MDYIEITKEKKIKKEFRQLSKFFKNLPQGKKKLAEKLIENAAFMIVTLADLREKISEEGAIKTVTNGNGISTEQENPAQKSYVAMMNRFNATMKILIDMLPEQDQKESKLLELMQS